MALEVLVASGGRGGKICPSRDGRLEFACVSFRLEHLFPLFANEEIAWLDKVAENVGSFKFYAATSSVARQCHELLWQVPKEFDLSHRCQLLRIIGIVLAEELRSAGWGDAKVRAADGVAELLEQLTVDDLLSLSVEELAAKFCCSRRHLSRLFHQALGFSAAALRMEMRMTKAASLLRDPQAKVINVAERCGFNHLGLFNTCFKRRFGMNPSQWRKQSPSLAHDKFPVGSVGSVLRSIGFVSAEQQPEHPPPKIAAPKIEMARPSPRGEVRAICAERSSPVSLADSRGHATVPQLLL